MNKFFKWLAFLCLFLIMASLIIMWHLSPILNPFPIPNGPYAVGITTQEYTDAQRLDIHPNTPFARRTFVVDYYYPTRAVEKATQYPYRPAFIAALKNEHAHDCFVSKFLWNRFLSGITSYAGSDVSIDVGNYPIILFVPGIGSDAMYSVYLEELASQGYIIAVLNPTHDIKNTIFTNGTVIGLDKNFTQAIAQADRTKIYNYRAQAHHEWLADLNFMVEKIKEHNKDPYSMFYQKIDIDRLGVLGHSHGGAVAIDFCKSNPACKAGINMDGWTKTANTTQGFNKPFLFLLTPDLGIADIDVLLKNLGAYGHKTIIANAGHGAFSDLILLKQPLRYALKVNKGNSQAVAHEIQKDIKHFFDVHI